MTKDAEKVLMKLYRAYAERCKTMSKAQARDFSMADADEALKGIPGEDANEAMCELRDEGYLTLYFLGACKLESKAVEYGERSFERTAEGILDVISKLKP